MCFGGPSISGATPPPPTATASDPAVVAALDRDRRRRAAMDGRQSTILTSGSGLTTATTPALKTVLGQ